MMRIFTGVVSAILILLFVSAYASKPKLIDGVSPLSIYKIDANLSKFEGREFLIVYVDPGKIDYSIESSNTEIVGTNLMIDFYARQNFIPRLLWSKNKNTFSDPWGPNVFAYEITENVSKIKVRHSEIVLWERGLIDETK